MTNMSLLTHLLACLFGIGSWISINGLWVELPLIVPEIAEGSYLSVLIQISIFGPIFVTVMHRFRPGVLNKTAVNHRPRHCSQLLAMFLLEEDCGSSQYSSRCCPACPNFLPLCCRLHFLGHLPTLHDAPETPLLVHLLCWRGSEWPPPCTSGTGPRCWGGKLCQQHPFFEQDPKRFQCF